SVGRLDGKRSGDSRGQNDFGRRRGGQCDGGKVKANRELEIRSKSKSWNPSAILLLLFSLILIRLTSAQTNGAADQIDLPTALRLAGAQNLDVQIGRERLAE